MKTLQEMVGENILVLIPQIHQSDLKQVKLHAVEHAGLWIENDEFTQLLMSAFGYPAMNRTPLFFVPFHEIKFVMQAIDQTALSGKAFGV